MNPVVLTSIVAIPLAAAATIGVRRQPSSSGRLATYAAVVTALMAGIGLVLTGLEDEGVIAAGWLAVDRPAAILITVVAATAAVVMSFAARNLDREPRTVLFFTSASALVAGSILVLAATNPALMALGWIGSGWALVAAVGYRSEWSAVRPAQRRIAASIAVGDAALVGALAVAAWADVSIIDRAAEPGSVADSLSASSLAGVSALHVAALLVVVAGLSRSALFPFHRWLAGTLVAPTPVSALVHAGLVSGAGILLVRTHEVFIASSPAVWLAFAAGLFTVLLASSVSVGRSDTKGSLAWSTVAQMAFMVVQCAVGAFSSAVVHIAGHGMYKASMFLGASDTVSASLKSHRSPVGKEPLGLGTRYLAVAVASAAAVGAAAVSFPPLLGDAGTALAVIFAWASVAHGLSSWLRRASLSAGPALGWGLAAAFAASFAYFASLRVFETFMKPNLVTVDTAVGVEWVIAAVAVVAVVAAAFALGVPGARALGRLQLLLAGGGVAGGLLRKTNSNGTSVDSGFDEAEVVSRSELARVRADVSKASALVAPMWPLSSFVAVNPLGGLESQGFEEATATARRWLGARTHLALADYRSDHARGLTTLEDLEQVVAQRFTAICASGAVEIEGRSVEPHEIIVTDLMHGPETPIVSEPRTVLERMALHEVADLIDELVGEYAARYMSSTSRGGRTFTSHCLDLACDDPRLVRLASPTACAWLGGLVQDPAEVLARALAITAVGPDERVDEIRGHLARIAGWAGLAKWRNEWASPNDPRPDLAPIEVVAVRSALEAAVVGSTSTMNGELLAAGRTQRTAESALLNERVEAVGAILAPKGEPSDLEAIRSVLESVGGWDRNETWLRAQELSFDRRLMGLLDRVDPGPRLGTPDAQLVFCIDVRSEGLRRHLENAGNVETFGFAGFFGLPMSVRRLGWKESEARCPVLVAPSVPVSEHPNLDSVDAAASDLNKRRITDGLRSAHKGAKHGLGGAFAMAEAAGWLVGPRAAWKTFFAPKANQPSQRHTFVGPDDGVMLEQRVFVAESALTTMGLTDRFAPVVVLCGHGSATVNNAHATALDCGACAGAAGDDNALAVVGLLNDVDVRAGLAERGIEIPDETLFVAGLHDTASDHVTILDRSSAPQTHTDALSALQLLLDQAGAANAAERARHLTGPSNKVRDRGADWAQVRPEWGLARAAAFIIGPRSLTEGLDLDGRTFLHSYDQGADPTGRVLETIMTAPMVVGHWISAQYYFSTVDPETFGAGDKVLHNPIGSLGVISGEGGDLRVGLPLQSTHIDGRRHHQPLRLLSVIQADLELIEEIIARNNVLRTLTSGSWLRIAARSHPHEPWSMRTPEGTWLSCPRPLHTDATLRQSDASDDSPVRAGS